MKGTQLQSLSVLAFASFPCQHGVQDCNCIRFETEKVALQGVPALYLLSTSSSDSDLPYDHFQLIDTISHGEGPHLSRQAAVPLSDML